MSTDWEWIDSSRAECRGQVLLLHCQLGRFLMHGQSYKPYIGRGQKHLPQARGALLFRRKGVGLHNQDNLLYYNKKRIRTLLFAQSSVFWLVSTLENGGNLSFCYYPFALHCVFDAHCNIVIQHNHQIKTTASEQHTDKTQFT